MQQWLTMFRIESTAMQERCLVAPSPILTLDETCKQCLTVLRVESDAGEMSCSAFCLSRISRTQDTRCHHLKLWYSSTTCFNHHLNNTFLKCESAGSVYFKYNALYYSEHLTLSNMLTCLANTHTRISYLGIKVDAEFLPDTASLSGHRH